MAISTKWPLLNSRNINEECPVKEHGETTAERYHFIVPVWGRAYVDMFVNYCIPSQLSEGNIPALPRGMTSYHILTHPEDVESIREAASVKLLKNYCDVVIEEFEDTQVYDEWKQPDSYYIDNLFRMTWCYQRGLQKCRGTDTAFWFMTPDSILADGALRYVHECQLKGYRAVMALGLITDRDRIRNELRTLFRAKDCEQTAHERFTISPRELVATTMKSLHPLAISRFMKDGGNRFLSAYYWETTSGFVARCFYLHPMMVRPRQHIDRIPSTVDYRYVQSVCPDHKDIHIVDDSDKLFYVDMADFRHITEGYPLFNHRRKDIMVWMREWTDYRHRHLFETRILVHTEDVDESWSQAIDESDRYSEALLEDFFAENPDLSAEQPPDYPTNLMVPKKSETALAIANPASASAAAVLDASAADQRNTTICVNLRLIKFNISVMIHDRAKSLAKAMPKLARKAVKHIYKLINYKIYRHLHHLEHQIAQQRAYTKTVEDRLQDHMLQITYHFWNSLGHFNKTSEEIKLLRPFLISLDYAVQQQLRRLEDHLATEARPSEQNTIHLENVPDEGSCTCRNERAA